MTYFPNFEYWVKHAQDVVYNTYGDRVSIDNKMKDLLKFGQNTSLGSTAATIATFPSGVNHETYVERNLITQISSSSTADVGNLLKLEYHISGSDVSVSSITRSSDTATVTTSSAHGFSVNEWVNVEGANETDYNGVVKVATVPTTTTFTYTVRNTPTTPATGTIITNTYSKTFGVQEVTLNGRTPVNLTTACSRNSRLYNAEYNKAFDIEGDIYVHEAGTVTNGVPDDLTKVHIMIAAGAQQSQKAATTLSSQDYWFPSLWYGDILEKASNFAELQFQIKLPGGVFRTFPKRACSSTGGALNHRFPELYIIPPNSDIRIVGVGPGSGTTNCISGIQGALGNIVS